ncbi:hypothetical protein NADE_006382 [Nannochloris sp. 'desiccata']|nr:hypothetical protein KSW81_008264 [Chlorella desiccata (nom. nud.)]KAH7619549.1 hypothetical protein NADE_006382 [Chlorella desiccata (nom. nud.)]
MPRSLIGHHGWSRACTCYVALLLLLLVSQVCARNMKSFDHLDEHVEKLFCGRTGHLCMRKHPSILHHRRSITGTPRSNHGESALNIDLSEASSLHASKKETADFTKSGNSMIVG